MFVLVFASATLILYGMAQITFSELWWWDATTLLRLLGGGGPVTERTEDWDRQQYLTGLCCILAGLGILAGSLAPFWP